MAIAAICHTCAHMCSTRAEVGCLYGSRSLYGGAKTASHVRSAWKCARQVLGPLPNCLRQPSFTNRTNASVGRQWSVQRHAPADPSRVDNTSPRLSCRGSMHRYTTMVRSRSLERSGITISSNVCNKVHRFRILLRHSRLSRALVVPELIEPTGPLQRTIQETPRYRELALGGL